MKAYRIDDFLNSHISEKEMDMRGFPSGRSNSKYRHPLIKQNSLSEEHQRIRQEIGTYYLHVGFSSLFQSEKLSFFVNRPNHHEAHRHPYIELMYVHAGQCVQVLNGIRIELRRGDLCLLDTSILQKYEEVSPETVIVNCAMWRPFFDHQFFSRFHAGDPLVHFFSEAYYHPSTSEQFIVFRSSNERIQWCMENALCEYFHANVYSKENIEHYLLLLLSELSRRYDRSFHWGTMERVRDVNLSKVINYIEENYRHVTLEQVARHFHYNASYLGRWLRRESGNSFKELIQRQRVGEAKRLLELTDMTIEEIANRIGYSNLTYLYKLFKLTYGTTPGDYRKKVQSG